MFLLEQLCFLFTIYSFLGWLCESIFCSILFKKWTNRGFLNGPFCPVYGIGGLLITSLLRPFTGFPFYIEIPLVFVAGTLLTTLLEYFTGWLLETLFHTTWWDYSKNRFNYKGRICLLNSILFGILCLVTMLVLHPLLLGLLQMIPPFLRPWLLLAVLAYFLIDSLLTLRTILTLNGKLQQMQELLDEFKATAGQCPNPTREIAASRSNLSSRVNSLAGKVKLPTRGQEELPNARHKPGEVLHTVQRAALQNLREKFSRLEKGTPSQRRLLRAFPTMKHLRNAEPLQWLQRRAVPGPNPRDNGICERAYPPRKQPERKNKAPNPRRIVCASKPRQAEPGPKPRDNGIEE